MVELTVESGYTGKTLKTFVMDRYPSLKQSVFAEALKNGDIKVNGQRCRKNIKLAEQDSIALYISDERLKDKFALNIVYEDSHVLIINKQTGLSAGDDKQTGGECILSLAEQHMRERGEIIPQIANVPHLVHRLDHYTGGLMVIAKSDLAADILVEAFRKRNVSKYYEAIVVGQPDPPEKELLHYMTKDAQKARVHIHKNCVKDSLPVVTRYRTLKSDGKLSLLELELVTGRTHQIRAHMAYIGHPILGDDKYGSRRANHHYRYKHQLLVCKRLVFHLGPGLVISYLDDMEFKLDPPPFPDSIRELPLFQTDKTDDLSE